MLMLRLWNYIRGYVIIIVEGYFLEKFINISIHRQIFLWDINRRKNNTTTLKVSIKGFKMLRPIVRKTRCKVRIERKIGLPFLLRRYKTRKAFIIGLVACFALFYFLSSFIWAVEITGNDKLKDEYLIERLEASGLKTGILKYGVDTDDVVRNMMIDIKELAWIGVAIKGTKVKVQVVERVTAPQVVPSDVPCDIVASRDGLISNIYAKFGKKVVNAGDTVAKGQVLISGTVKGQREDSTERFVHAIGEVEARTWYEASCDVSINLTEKTKTGNYKTNYTLYIFKWKISPFKPNIKYENYESERIVKELKLGEDLILPFKLVVDRTYENSIIERELTLDEAEKIAKDKAYEKASKGIPKSARIVKSSVNIVEKGDGMLEANATIECLEDIALTKEIGGK